MALSDFEDTVRFHKAMSEILIDWVRNQFALARDGKIIETQAHGQKILKELTTATEVTDFFVELTVAWRTAGFEPAIEQELADAASELNTALERFSKNWPLLADGDIQRGRDEIARGEFVTQLDFLGGRTS